MTRSTRQPAFTLMELMVAISITALMLFLISRIFFDTTTAVTQGVATSQVIENSRTISNQIERDAAAMIGPAATGNPAGFLVILNHTVTAAMAQPNGGETTQTIQDDQLMFIADGSKVGATYTALSPGSTTSYSNTATAQYTRIWYGHGQGVNADGTDGGAFSPIPADPNRLANQWILCRQATLLAGGTPGVSVYADDASEMAVIHGYTLPPGISAHTWEGLSDVAAQDLVTGTTPLLTAVATAGYPAGAYPYTYGTQRLRVNPIAQPSYNSWQIAQAHPYLMGGVSDFEVAFAADVDNDGAIDVDVAAAGTDKNGIAYSYSGENIKWYSHFANDPTTPASFDSTKPVTYQPTGYTPYDSTTPPAPANGAFVWQHTDAKPFTETVPPTPDADNSKWPYLIRIRYRLHDSRGNLQSYLNGNTVLGKWFEQIIKVNRPTP